MPLGSIQGNSPNLWIQPTTASKSLWIQPITASKSLAITTYAPAVKNQDGVVSPAERLAYELGHPTPAPTSGSQSFLLSDSQSGRLQNQIGSVSQGRSRNSSAKPPAAPGNLATASYAAADTDHYGVMTPAERLAYELSHPAMTSTSRSRSMTQPATAPRKTAAMGYDPADSDQDGVVSPAELLAYELSHPSATLDKSQPLTPAYTQRGGLPAQSGGNLFDLNA